MSKGNREQGIMRKGNASKPVLEIAQYLNNNNIDM
jgi:hypothetical protein